MTKKEFKKAESTLESMRDETEKIILKYEKEFDLGFLKEIELMQKKDDWFAELNYREFEVWEYKQLELLKDYKSELSEYKNFIQKGKYDLLIEEINTARLPPFKPEIEKLAILEKLKITSCEKSYSALVANSKSIPNLKYDKKKFPIKPIDDEPKIEE